MEYRQTGNSGLFRGCKQPWFIISTLPRWCPGYWNFVNFFYGACGVLGSPFFSVSFCTGYLFHLVVSSFLLVIIIVIIMPCIYKILLVWSLKMLQPSMQSLRNNYIQINPNLSKNTSIPVRWVLLTSSQCSCPFEPTFTKRECLFIDTWILAN